MTAASAGGRHGVALAHALESSRNRCTLLCAPPVCVRATTQPLPLSEEQMTSRGPPSGALVVAGGSVVAGSAIYDRFAELAVMGGEDYIVYVPTASGSPCERSPLPPGPCLATAALS